MDNKYISSRLVQNARIDFFRWHTLIFPYIKGIPRAKATIWRLRRELFLTFLTKRSVIINHSSGKTHYFEKLNREEYLKTCRELKELIREEINYTKYAKKQIKELED